MRFNPFGMFGTPSREEERMRNQQYNAIAQQAADSRLGQLLASEPGGAFVGPAPVGTPVERSVLFDGLVTNTGPFTSWIRGLEMKTEIIRFDFLVWHKRNAPDKLEFRRKVGILNWMEVVKDYKE